MRLKRGRVRSMVRAALLDQTAIVCHKTLDTEQNAVCRGFFDRFRDRVLPLRLAGLMDALAFQTRRRPGG